MTWVELETVTTGGGEDKQYKDPEVWLLHLSHPPISLTFPCLIRGPGLRAAGAGEAWSKVWFSAPSSFCPQGDSGGPLVCDSVIRGVVSYGDILGTPPAVFTRVLSFMPWIKRTMRRFKQQGQTKTTL